MYLSHISFEQFRCYVRQELDLPPAGIRLAGENASGKTSLIEGVQLLSMMKSARAGAERDLINWNSNQEFGLPPYARVKGTVEDAPHLNTIEITLSVDPNRSTHARKQIKLDDQPKRAIDAVGRLKTVLFEPEDMDLVLGSPSVRRRYLDVAISTLDSTYLRLLSQYNKILEQRNSLLKSLRDQSPVNRRTRVGELDYWDQELINRAAYIVAARLQFIARAEHPLDDAFRSLLGEEYALRMEYEQSTRLNDGATEGPADAADTIELQRTVSNRLESEIEQRRDEELSRGVTAVGPHRDDLKLLLDERELESFGSRGQQRLAVVSVKLAEIALIRQVTGETAVLLLDDVLSELDAVRRERLLARISGLGGQVVVTATDASLLDLDQLQDLPLFNVQSGHLIPAGQ